MKLNLEIELGDYELRIHPLYWKLLPTYKCSKGSYNNRIYWKSYGFLFITFIRNNNEDINKTCPNWFKSKLNN